MRRLSGFLLAAMMLLGCESHQPITTVAHVDLQRFMGDWYVIANIPTFLEKGAHNAVESYELNQDGTIGVTFHFQADAFDGERKVYHPTGYVIEGSGNAVWGMQFLWPIKAEYRVIYLDSDYEVTVIGRSKRDYVWIMARKPQITDSKYDQILQFLQGEGYDIGKIERVPQLWSTRQLASED